MEDRSIGRSEPLIRRPGTVDRSGSSTDRRKKRQEEPQHAKDDDERKDRRTRDPVNQRRRRLFDLLFEEIEQTPGIDRRQKDRLKDNLRAHILGRAMVHPPTPEEIEAALHGPDDPDAHPDIPVDPDHIVAAAAPTGEDTPPPDAMENAILAAQFRRCLDLHTTTARKVAVYIHLLLRLGGAMRPHIVVDI